MGDDRCGTCHGIGTVLLGPGGNDARCVVCGGSGRLGPPPCPACEANAARLRLAREQAREALALVRQVARWQCPTSQDGLRLARAAELLGVITDG